MANHRGRRVISATILEGLVRVGELALTLIVGIATYMVVVVPITCFSFVPLLGVPLVAVLVVLVMQSLGSYRVAGLRAPTRFGLRIIASWFAVFGLTFAVCSLAKDRFDLRQELAWALDGDWLRGALRRAYALSIITNYLDAQRAS